jgi:cysteine desulfurase
VIYLDYAATTPLSDTAWAAMEPFLRDRFGNPSEPHAAGRAARAGLDEARGRVAAVLGLGAADVVFCAGGSEADNLAVLGRIASGGRVVASAIEHPAVREPLRAYAARGGAVDWVGVDRDGVVDVAAADALVRPGDAGCFVMWANNVTGTVQPVAAIAELCAARGVPFHTDAVQAASGLAISAGRLGDQATLAIAAHKIGGPKGVGVLAGRGVSQLAVVLRGGGQEHGLRPGTENVAGAAAVAAALEDRQSASAGGERRARAARRDALEARLGYAVAGSAAARLPGHSLLLCGARGDTIVGLLDQEGLCVAAGAACSSAASEPSHVLAAMGFDPETARTALRVTLGPQTTDADTDALARALPRIVERLQAAAVGVT